MLTERRRGHAADFIKDAVKLREAAKAALLGDRRYFVPGMDQQLMGFADPGHLDILCQRNAGDRFELV
ncbi:hypothetical protein D3C81_2023220 [compost metagenome]